MSRLRDVLLAEGGLLAGAVGEDGTTDELAARLSERHALAVEAVREGHRLHAGAPRVVTEAEPDLALLAGDRLYALGLAQLAGRGDLEAISELADIIALCALAQASGDAELAEAAWRAGTDAIAHGRGPDHPGAAAAVQGAHGATMEPPRA